MIILRVLAFGLGLLIVLSTLASATRTFVLPRSSRDPLSATVFLTTRKVFDFWTRRANSYEARDRTMAFYAPISLLLLPAVWLVIVMIGYMAMYWALGVDQADTIFKVSGSSLLTLGFASVETIPTTILAFSEAAIGLVLVALLIAYLPVMYGAFSKREAAVTMLEVRAGSPPSAIELLLRYQRIGPLDRLNRLWTDWELWFVELEESHTSLAALAFFRSPQPDHSWVTAAGTVLDAAALTAAALDVPRDPQVALTIRAGYIALRHVADFFRIEYDADPAPGGPISITRPEFDAAYEQLAAGNLPMKADRDAAWRDFVGWRVNYDTVLLALAALTMAPYAPWSSDRGVIHLRPRHPAHPAQPVTPASSVERDA